jgi:hypothetical protein
MCVKSFSLMNAAVSDEGTEYNLEVEESQK